MNFDSLKTVRGIWGSEMGKEKFHNSIIPKSCDPSFDTGCYAAKNESPFPKHPVRNATLPPMCRRFVPA